MNWYLDVEDPCAKIDGVNTIKQIKNNLARLRWQEFELFMTIPIV
jgi:hypothetical protein